MPRIRNFLFLGGGGDYNCQVGRKLGKPVGCQSVGSDCQKTNWFRPFPAGWGFSSPPLRMLLTNHATCHLPLPPQPTSACRSRSFSAASAPAAGFAVGTCASSSSELVSSSSPAQNCCKIQSIQNCLFRRPRENPIDKRVDSSKTATIWIDHPDIVRL